MPSIDSSCSPIQCHEMRSPENGNAKLSPSKDPMQDSVYVFRCKKSYWLSGTDHTVCKKGSWTIESPPRCVPMPCNSSPCINGGTCINTKRVKGYSYQCRCTSEWHGDTCEHRTVYKATLINEVKTFVKNSGGVCKSRQLYDYLADSIRGRYSSYMWTVVCQFGNGWMDFWMESEGQIIYVESKPYQTWVLWQDSNLPSKIISRYNQGKTKAMQRLAKIGFNCPGIPSKIVYEIYKELKEINLNYLMIMVMRSQSRYTLSYDGRSEMVSSYAKEITCNIGGRPMLILRRFRMDVVVIGAQYKT